MKANVRSSAALVWRHQRLLWSIVAINLALAWLSSLPLRAMLHPILDHSMESAKLVTGFDVSTLILLNERPDAPMRALTPAGLAAAILYLPIVLVLDGGIIAVYLEDRRMALAEFFQYCGLYWWRMARMALYSIVPFGLLAAGHSALSNYAGKLSHDAPQERLGFFVKLAGTLLILLVALLVRLCFDLAQARVVRDDRRAVVRTILRSLPTALRSGLYWQYLGITLSALASFVAGVWVWVYLPHRAFGAAFLVLELVTIVQIATRLWMKAASARWAALEVEDDDTGLLTLAAEPSLNVPQPE